ncbi:RagB/SusD family nutrient uptake outer membrane protein [Pedobacter frigidisoli]|uniref:RagB/SusD family nutrient uptake outer membrane protein n=1 Tax=Pedobacter frigidisoli TaxID=2530455 RepID=A0A4V2MMD9_9SPHI|nr:RagB/SusD family nutrient uptake outer membrane protein [Pedobacter frigidisoli]TCD05857.1 RagB/SusD family nutrient uptake outer membrane protein [Pedobacter frigidisoli]
MKKSIIHVLFILMLAMTYSCKDGFLDVKPKSDLVVPSTLSDFEAMLNNSSLYRTAALGQLSCDDYEYLDFAAWQSTVTATERNAYIWQRDLFSGEQARPDWNIPYSSVFYANNVLESMKKLDPATEPERYNQVKGWALFVRSAAFYDLLQNFAPPYEVTAATFDLGIPLRLSPGIDEILPRADLATCYARIITDLTEAASLLTATFPSSNRYQPCKAAAFGLLSRIYLNMNQFANAHKYTDMALSHYNKLIDYNTVSQASATPFSFTNDETILNSGQVLFYETTISRITNTRVKVSPSLIALYETKDLRLPIFFEKNTNGSYSMKRGYFGGGSYGFSGIATDELYLTKAECQARDGDTNAAISTLNQLLIKRYATNFFSPVTASNPVEALSKILIERRKELVWRNLRWSDLRRLNKSGSSITLKRILNGTEHTLEPNSPRYTFPIPDDEINASGIIQNIR